MKALRILILSLGLFAACVASARTSGRDSLPAIPLALDELSVTDRVWIMAHRCHTENPAIPENSLAALNAAIAAGADVVETDTQRTKDGFVVISHDRTINGNTDGKGRITGMTLEKLKTFHLKDREGNVTSETIPTLEEFLLAAKGRVYVNLDYSPRTASTGGVLAVVEKLDMVQQVFLYCNTRAKVEEVLEHNPEANVYFPSGLCKCVNGRRFFQTGWHPGLSDKSKTVKKSRKAVEKGFMCSVNLLHVNDGRIPEYEIDTVQVRSLMDLFPDCRMIQTDCPDLLVPKLKEMGLR